MAAPTQIAVFDLANHDGSAPDTGIYPVRILNVGNVTDDVYTLNGVDVAAGALVLPIVPGSVVATATDLSLEIVAAEPVITVESADAISVTIGTGIYAGLYTDRHDGALLTVAMIEAAPTCLIVPTISGATAVGSTLTVTPGLWIYAGTDPGDQTWVQRLDGMENGETDLDYVIQAQDAGKTLTIEETFGGVTITSAPIAL